MDETLQTGLVVSMAALLKIQELSQPGDKESSNYVASKALEAVE